MNASTTTNSVNESEPLVRPATLQETANLTHRTPSCDFIRTYAQYADVLEAPREMHEAVAIQLLATVLNRNGVTIRHGGLRYSLDLWQVLLSGSGLGRTTLMGLAELILEKAELENMVQKAHWGSPQALYQQMAENPHGLYLWGEMSEKLKLLNNPGFLGAKPWLTDRYDNWRTPEPITYRDTGRRSRDTPPIVFSCAPRLNILASSSEEWFFSNLAQEDSVGGFVPRWMLIHARGVEKDVPTTKEPDQRLVEPLANHLRCISQLKGDVDLSAILSRYDPWYRETKGRFRNQPNRALAMAYFYRHRVHVLKLAAVYEISSTRSLRVSAASWERAVRTAKQAEETIFSLLSTGMSKEGYEVSKMEGRVHAAGATGLRLAELTRAFQHDARTDRFHRLATLLEGESVYAYTRPTRGRSATVLVHAEFHDEYEARHPGQVPASLDFYRKGL